MPLSGAASAVTPFVKAYDIFVFTGDRILEIADEFRLLKCEDAAAVDVTVPPFSDVEFILGTQISVLQFAAGIPTFVAGVGVTIETPTGLSVSALFGIGTIILVDDDIWVAAGALA